MTVRNVVEYRPAVSRKKISDYMHRFNLGLREARDMAIKVQLSTDIVQAKDAEDLKPVLCYLVRVLHKELACDIRD